ncbi:MAG TPA: hypothetical protein DCE41_36975 [Cytophagales bacterium]|nr:hypothetical protein [Cytophagales bacterium]HAA21165.1 hypothetical protein [Cytophagales bacterium]HAP60685.1 hypothetical protein [Cytophagales bacterium]
MTPLFKKLNYKDQKSILILNSPDSFREEEKAMGEVADVLFDVGELDSVPFALVFATQQVQIDHAIASLNDKLKGDALLWFAYPKGSSKKYKCDFNRDTGWEEVGKYGFEGVRQVAIDTDWSALRFRRVEFIKNLTRRKSMAMTSEAKSRTSGK